MFKEECKTEDALDRLWIAVARRSWRGAPNLQLDCDTKLAADLVYEKADKYGIPGLRLLPPELIRMIRDHFESGTFWRYISVVSFGRELSAISRDSNLPSPITSIPLCNISAWSRGREPTLLQSPDRPPIIRLTIDYRGIRQIERLPRWPSCQYWRSNNMAFAIQEESQLRTVTTQVKVVAFSNKLIPRSNAA